MEFEEIEITAVIDEFWKGEAPGLGCPAASKMGSQKPFPIPASQNNQGHGFDRQGVVRSAYISDVGDVAGLQFDPRAVLVEIEAKIWASRGV